MPAGALSPLPSASTDGALSLHPLSNAEALPQELELALAQQEVARLGIGNVRLRAESAELRLERDGALAVRDGLLHQVEDLGAALEEVGRERDAARAEVASAQAEREAFRADAELGLRLVAILSNHCGERGESEGAAEVLQRIIRERNESRASAITSGATGSADAQELRRKVALLEDDVRALTQRLEKAEARTDVYRATTGERRQQAVDAEGQVERLAAEVKQLRAQVASHEEADERAGTARALAEALYERPVPLTSAGTQNLAGLLFNLLGGGR